MRRFKESLWFNKKSNKYRVSLPHRQYCGLLADNYEMSYRRLLTLLQRFKRNPKLYEDYNKVMTEQIQSGVLEPVPDEPPEVGKAYYLPHHCVIREDHSTTKLRVVLDGSAKTVGPSLNQCLHKGPSLMPELVRVLMGFRCHLIAVVGDLEKAFLQIEMSDEDRDYLRTLWVSNFDPKAVGEDFGLTMLRFAVCVWGITSSPFHLLAITKHHTDKYKHLYPAIVKEIQRSLFVDDLTSGADTVREGYQLFITAKKIFKEGGFNLRKFVTNSPELRLLVDADESVTDSTKGLDDVTYAEVTQHSIENPQPVVEQKVLGVVWNKEADQFIYRFDVFLEVASTLPRTKCRLLPFRSVDCCNSFQEYMIQWDLFVQFWCN